MQTVISLAPLIICIITAVLTRKEAAPLEESTKKVLKILNLVGIAILAISLLWTIIGGIFSMVVINSYSSFASSYGGSYASSYIGASIATLIIWFIIMIAVDLALAYWHYYLLEKKLGGFKNAFKFNTTTTPPAASKSQPPVIEVNTEEDKKEEEKEN